MVSTHAVDRMVRISFCLQKWKGKRTISPLSGLGSSIYRQLSGMVKSEQISESWIFIFEWIPNGKMVLKDSKTFSAVFPEIDDN